MNRFALIVASAGLLAGLGAAAYFTTTSPKEPTPAENRTPGAASKKAKLRIVGLNGTITETVFALGAGPAMVGRDTSSYYPVGALKLPTVGYQHRLNAEGILRLRPTLVIGVKGVKPASVLDQIKAAGVKVLLVAKPNNVALSKAMITKLGSVLKREDQARSLIAKMDQQLATLKKLKQEAKAKAPRVIALYVRGKRMRFVLGKKTTVGGMIDLIGAPHAVDFAKVKPISSEALVAAKPDVVVAFAKGVASIGGPDKLAALPGMALTPAGKKRRFVVMDDLFLGGFGPRTGHAAVALFKKVYGVPATK